MQSGQSVPVRKAPFTWRNLPYQARQKVAPSFLSRLMQMLEEPVSQPFAALGHGEW